MAIAETFLPEFDREMAVTRTLLERIPSEKAAWKPHPKSMAMGDLGLHLANLPAWASMTMQGTEFDVAPPDGGEGLPRRVFETTEALVETFDKNVREAREAIAAASDEELMVPWSLKNGGNVVFTMPRAAVLRSFVVSHSIHHRGQLDVYLRLNDVPLPPVYGPTADMAG